VHFTPPCLKHYGNDNCPKRQAKYDHAEPNTATK
jgi:hypothetical protein